MKAMGDGFIKYCCFAIEMSGIPLSAIINLVNMAECSTSLLLLLLLLHPGFNAFSISLPHAVALYCQRVFVTRDWILVRTMQHSIIFKIYI